MQGAVGALPDAVAFGGVVVHVVGVEDVEDDEDGELRRDEPPVFHLVFDGKELDFVEGIAVFAVSVGGEEDGGGALAFSGLQGFDDDFAAPADADADGQAFGIGEDGGHADHIVVGDGFADEPDTHEAEFHFLRDHAGAAFAVDVNPLFVQEQRGDAADLPHVDDGVGFVEQFLVAGEDGLDEVATAVVFCLVVRVEEFAQAAEAAFL